ncbi:MAG: hypothetical protein GF353_01615 [Candidatus Lokiarchaeota archaeon]|nr:hypothetical protein [Candidatus Lokiarchaeota archaeon]
MEIKGLDALPHKTVVTGFELEIINTNAFSRMKDYARSCEWALDGYHDPKPGNLYYDGPILVHVINELLEMRLYAPKRVEIFVDGKQFAQCKFLLLNLDLENVDTAIGAQQVQSIDEAEHFFARHHSDKREFENHSRRIAAALSPEETFRAHSSNLQVWAENKYDSRLLHRSLAFPLLKRLTEVGDPVALLVFKEEIARCYASGHPTVQKFLKKEGYLNHLSEEELESLN